MLRIIFATVCILVVFCNLWLAKKTKMEDLYHMIRDDICAASKEPLGAKMRIIFCCMVGKVPALVFKSAYKLTLAALCIVVSLIVGIITWIGTFVKGFKTSAAEGKVGTAEEQK